MPHTGTDENPTPDIGLRGIELLDKIIQTIEEMPEHWEQGAWATDTEYNEYTKKYNKSEPFITTEDLDSDGYLRELPEFCGTAFCVAGWAAHLTGAKILWRPLIDWDHSAGDEFISGIIGSSCVDPETDEVESISWYARKVLGLSVFQGEMLFRPENSLDRIKAIRNHLAGNNENNENNEDNQNNED